MTMNILSIGAEPLSFERNSSHGAALEECVLGALRLLEYVLSIDEHAVADLRAKHKDAVFYHTLDEVLSSDMSQMANVLGYVQYKYNPAIPLVALKILRVLCRRVEHIVLMLPPASRAAIVEGCASCLELAFATVPPGDAEDDIDANTSSAIECASLVFDLLHENLERRGTNLTHLLLGFDLTGARMRWLSLPLQSSTVSVFCSNSWKPHRLLCTQMQSCRTTLQNLQRIYFTDCRHAKVDYGTHAVAHGTVASSRAKPSSARSPFGCVTNDTSIGAGEKTVSDVSPCEHSSSLRPSTRSGVPPAKGRVPEMAPPPVLDIMNVLLDNGREGLGTYSHTQTSTTVNSQS